MLPPPGLFLVPLSLFARVRVTPIIIFRFSLPSCTIFGSTVHIPIYDLRVVLLPTTDVGDSDLRPSALPPPFPLTTSSAVFTDSDRPHRPSTPPHGKKNTRLTHPPRRSERARARARSGTATTRRTSWMLTVRYWLAFSSRVSCARDEVRPMRCASSVLRCLCF